jgi:hypothetical protein
MRMRPSAANGLSGVRSATAARLVCDRPFDDLDRYITQSKLRSLSENDKKVAGYALTDARL